MQQMDLFSSSKASSSVYITASVGASARKCAFKSHRRKSESWRRSRQSGTRHWRSVVMFSQHMMFEYTSNMSHAALWLPLVGVHFLNTTVWRGGGKTHCKHTRTQRDTHTHTHNGSSQTWQTLRWQRKLPDVYVRGVFVKETIETAAHRTLTGTGTRRFWGLGGAKLRLVVADSILKWLAACKRPTALRFTND